MSCFVVICWSEFLIIQWIGEHIREKIYRYDPHTHTPSKRPVQWSQQWESHHFQVYIVYWNHLYWRSHCNWMKKCHSPPSKRCYSRCYSGDLLSGTTGDSHQKYCTCISMYGTYMYVWCSHALLMVGESVWDTVFFFDTAKLGWSPS